MKHFFILTIILLVVAGPNSSYSNGAGKDDQKLSLSDAVQTLDADFQKPPTWRSGAVQTDESARPLNDPSFSWAAGYIWNHPPVGVPPVWPLPDHDFPAWTSNATADADPNGDMNAQLGALAPLTWSGTLALTARRMPPQIAATVDKSDPHDFIGAAITSFPYSQLYGVFAMSAKLPRGNGLWPAFWLLPVDKTWPPEIDVMEVIGREPNKLYLHLHFPDMTAPGIGIDTHVNLSADFHEYAVDWGPDEIKWYFDRKLVYSQPTHPSLHKPFYIIANLAVGKPDMWGGAPDRTTTFPATMQIKYIKAWQRSRYSDALPIPRPE